MGVESSAASSTLKKLQRAKAAASQLAQLSTSQKNSLLLRIADALDEHSGRILRANAEDIQHSNLAGAMRDRLLLTPQRISQIADSVREVAKLADPVNEVVEEWSRPNGLLIRKVRVPLGVVGIVYESRPNVTVDAAVLCVKTGNAVVLRGGKEASASNQALAEIMTDVESIPTGAIELLDSSSRDTVRELIRARGLIDVVIPRGGPGLITHVMENALVPVIETGAGNCHIFVDESADFEMANRIILNAKTQRPSVCNAAEKLLVHSSIAAKFIPQMVRKLIDGGVDLRGDEASRQISPEISPASEADWSEEYLRLCMAIRIVSGVDEAIAHMNRYSTRHSEAIVTANASNADKFLQQVDSAAVYWNASTRFTDGAEFGFGAEMGVSTQKLHCRGPFALKELTSTKYQVIGTGQARD